MSFYSSSAENKPISGVNVIDQLNVDNLNVRSIVVEEIFNVNQLNNVIITNSQINNTIIGGNNGEYSADGYFNILQAKNDVTFFSDVTFNGNNGDVYWNSIESQLEIQGCTVLDKIKICGNTISTFDNNFKDINIQPISSGNIIIPNNTKLLFGSLLDDSYIKKNPNNSLVINSNKSISINSTNVSINDPILSISSLNTTVLDSKDKGIEFLQNNTNNFFGYKQNSDRFVFIRNGNNNDEIFSGSFGSAQFSELYLTGNNKIATEYGDLYLQPTTGNNIIIPSNTHIAFGSTDNSIQSYNNNLYLKASSGIILESPVYSNNFDFNNGTLNNSTIGDLIPGPATFTDLSLQKGLFYSFERLNISQGNLSQNPNPNIIITMISVNENGEGYLSDSNLNIKDGTLKIILCNYVKENCKYTLFFNSDKLITPNPLNINNSPTRIIFKRRSQSVQLVFDSQYYSPTNGAWILLNSGAYIE